MCGIIGVVGFPEASKALIESLERLAYRGYDSAGIVTCEDGQAQVLKRVGKIHVLKEAVAERSSFAGDIGIGHTRWATHGRPTENNAHPLQSQDHRYYVICNGIIENYRTLRERLTQEGYSFTTQTDTEVIPLLLQSYPAEMSLRDKVLKVLGEIEGSYAIVILDTEEPDQLWGARTGSPLLVARNGRSSFLASDAPAILEHTNDVHYLNDGEVVQIKAHSASLMDFQGQEVSANFQKIDLSYEKAEKEGYAHYMLKEIHEQSQVVERTIKSYLNQSRIDFSEFVSDKVVQEIEEVVFVACGTAYHAGLVGQYLFESVGLRTRSLLASEFHLFPSPVTSKSLVIAVTQSGETIDTLYAIRKAQEMGAQTLAICNVHGATIVRESDMALMMQAGEEIGVASTKAYLAMLTVIGMLGPWLSNRKGLLKEEFDFESYQKDLLDLPVKIKQVLESYDNLNVILKEFAHFNDYFYIARGFNLPTALEGALKLKELSYLHAEGYGAGEMKHGPIALVDDRLLTIAVSVRDGLERKITSNIEEIRARGGRVFLIAAEDAEESGASADWVFRIPKVRQEFSPLLAIIPLQILAYEVAVSRECDPDQPRNLAKSVTVE